MTVMDLKGIVGLGGGLDFSAGGFGVMDLKGLAGLAGGSGARLTIRDVGHLSVMDLKGIAGLGKGSVTFVF